MSRWAQSVDVGPLTFTRLPVPSRPGFGVFLLIFTVWVFMTLFRICLWMAQWTVVGIVALVAIVADQFRKP